MPLPTSRSQPNTERPSSEAERSRSPAMKASKDGPLASRSHRLRSSAPGHTWADAVAILSFLAPLAGETGGFLRVPRTLRLLQSARSKKRDEPRLGLCAFDIFGAMTGIYAICHVVRRVNLGSLLKKDQTLLLHFLDSLGDPEKLLAACNAQRLEGIVSKRKTPPKSPAAARDGSRSSARSGSRRTKTVASFFSPKASSILTAPCWPTGAGERPSKEPVFSWTATAPSVHSRCRRRHA